MRRNLRFLGMDVHAETIAVAIAEPNGEVRSLGTIANREDSIRKLIGKLGSPERAACLLRSPDRIRTLLATDAVGCRVRSGGAEPGPEEARRPCED